MAGGKGDTWALQLMRLLLNATPIANVADNAASSPLTTFYVSLHTADPGHGGDQTTNEVVYTGYSRVSIARNNGSPAWTITGAGGGGAQATNATQLAFPQCTAGSTTAAWIAVGTAQNGAGEVLYRGQVTSPGGGLAILSSVAPLIQAGGAVLTES